MRRGIQRAAAFLLFLSEGVLERPFCQFEIREALALNKPMLLIHESDPRFGSFDFGKAGSTAPADLKEMLDNHESLPFRRRGYERDGMLQSLIERAGFKGLLESARNASSADVVELATMPQEIGHFDLESLQDRPVQAELIELLVLPKNDQRFTSCVLVHGMGGTGKTVTAVAVVQEAAIRTHFSNIYWLVVGQDATVGGKLRQLQSILYKQLTGKAVKSEEVQAKDEQEWCAMLVDAMAMQRALVVLDDPWLPEQVRYLNPVDGSRMEHRLLVTTRIRSLMPRAACIELALMSQDEAATLLLGLANIQQATYLKQHKGAKWPPKAAHDIAAECGLLPMTLSIASQVVRSWGDGWEKSVLPLLKQQHSNKSSAGGSGAALSTVEARIIGAGLKALKGEDADVIEELFGVFAVTQEDCVHSMPVIELLWRSCCASDSADDLGTRLKVRQWTQMLVDHSLLLGSFTKGVHLHDIVLTYLRNTLSPLELRALQKRVVEELVRVSAARPFEDTGSTSNAFAGEEVDWYVCNVGSFHIKQSIDRSVPVTENEDVARYLMLDDSVLFRQTALAAGEAELEVLIANFVAKSQWMEAAKAKWAVCHVSSNQSVAVAMMDEVVELLEKCGTPRTNKAQQLELDIIGSFTYNVHKKTGTPAKARVGARIVELSQNSSLRRDPWNLVVGSIYPKFVMLTGCSARAWMDDEKTVDGDSILKGMSMWYNGATPLMQSACDNAVGARKVRTLMMLCVPFILTVAYALFVKEWFTFAKLNTTPMGMFFPTAYNTEESVALFQAATNQHWGVDCSRLMDAFSVYDFNRHFQIARTTGFRMNMIFNLTTEYFVAEKTGNIQDCIEITTRKNRAMESYMRAAPSAGPDACYFPFSQGSFFGVEAHHQHLQLHNKVPGFLKYAGISNVQRVEEGYRSSAEWFPTRTTSHSSPNGLHHMFPEHAMVALIRAVLSFSMGTRDVDRSWLDDLPPADATTLHDTAPLFPTSARVLVAEMFEQQGRHADAIRFAQTDLQDYHNLNVVSKGRAGRVLGRCHAALGQHTLSVSAFDAAIELAQLRKLLLSEALSVRGRAAVGRNEVAGGSGLHWDEETGRQRLAEMMGRMQGPRDVLERVFLLLQ
jgi:hypothetical protein